jgi:lipopolysaccharide/colanic/teichoic acid biosynthesis glycosyltransferase
VNAKRAFDLIASLSGLVLLSPLLAAVAALVARDSPGPVFYRQERVGRHGVRFRIIKFRTMGVGADRAGGSLTVGADPRVTRVGRWLRALKIDELPQLLNVVRGEMSLVGPRPEVPKYVALYTPEQRRVLEVRPGITDLASLTFRDESALLGAAADPERVYVEEILPRKLALSLEYVDRQSLPYDLQLIWRTVSHVWLRRTSAARMRP